MRVDECNIVSLDLGDTPFSIARDLPPIFVLDLVVGDTFAQKRSGLRFEFFLGQGMMG